MNISTKRIKAKRGILLAVFGGIAWLSGAMALPVQEALADAYTSGCGPLICVDRDLVLSTLASHDDDVKSKPSQITLCHVESDKKSGGQHTIRVDASAEAAHMKHGDTLGQCVDTVLQAFVESLPTCTALAAGSAVTGVWVPEAAVGHGTGLNIYFFQVQEGTCSGYPDSSAESYRELRGE